MEMVPASFPHFDVTLTELLKLNGSKLVLNSIDLTFNLDVFKFLQRYLMLA